MIRQVAHGAHAVPTRMKSAMALAIALTLATVSAQAATWYVSPDGNDTDGQSWPTARNSLQTAVNLAAHGDEIIVGDGIYAPISTGNKAITISSVNGAEHTIIDGGNTTRCATLGTESDHTNTVLTGFTLRNGKVQSSSAHVYGGGVYGGTLNHCILTGNKASISTSGYHSVDAYGGGAAYSILNGCFLTGNTAHLDAAIVEYPNYGWAIGGGAYACTLNNCTLTGNTASSNINCADASFDFSGGPKGGGAADSTLHNCTFTENKVFCALVNVRYNSNTWLYGGGGAHNSTLNNCLLTGNTTHLHSTPPRRASAYGGGVIDSTLNNCTLVGNSASATGASSNDSYGGGVNNSIVNNCIIWGNSAGYNANFYNSTVRYSCSTPLPSGSGNISSDPRFVDATSGNLRLSQGSPCVNAGSNSYVASGALDLDGNLRIHGGTVDMGAYEYGSVPPATTVTVTYNANGGSALPTSATVTVGVPYGTLPTPTRTGHTFDGWFTAQTGGTLVTASTTVTQTTDHTLWARWTIDVPPPPEDAPYLTEDMEDGTLNATTAYDGFVYDGNKTVRGTLTLNAKVSKGVWTVSAKVILQSATLSFSGKQSGPLSSVVLHKNGATLALALGRDRFDGTLSGGAAGGAFTVCGARNDQADRLAGLYNVALLSGGGTEASATMGYLSLSVGKKNTVKLAGQLADGTKVSGSAKLLKGLNADGWYGIALFNPLYKKAGFIGGLLWVEPSSRVIRVDTDHNWFVDWKKASGLAERLDVVGGYFGTGKSAVMPPPGLTFVADVPADLPTLGSPWLDVPELSVNNAGTKLSFDKKGPSNPAGATLSYNAKTGVFKGKLPLLYTDTKGKSKANNAAYVGVMVPQDGALTGFGTGTATINKQKYGIPVYLMK